MPLGLACKTGAHLMTHTSPSFLPVCQTSGGLAGVMAATLCAALGLPLPFPAPLCEFHKRCPPSRLIPREQAWLAKGTLVRRKELPHISGTGAAQCQAHSLPVESRLDFSHPLPSAFAQCTTCTTQAGRSEPVPSLAAEVPQAGIPLRLEEAIVLRPLQHSSDLRRAHL